MKAPTAMSRMRGSIRSELQLPHTVACIRSARIYIDDSTAALSDFTREMGRLRDQFNLDIRLLYMIPMIMFLSIGIA